MKTLFITLSLLFALAVGSIYAATDKDIKVNETRKVEEFSSIRVTSVAAIYFTQGDNYSLKIEGKEEYVKEIVASVKNETLIIDSKRDEKGNIIRKNIKEGVDVYLTAPTLKNVEFTGVGSFNCKSPLKLENVKFNIEGVGKLNISDLTCDKFILNLGGVGNADVHVNCDFLKADVGGVGRVTLSGKAISTDISKSGVGSVNTRNLKVGK